jgi:hypothetical protein
LEFVDIGEGVGERHELPPSAGFVKIFSHACSRMVSSARLSVPSPRKTGCRISDLLVHSVNFTSPTSFGISHVVAFSEFTFWSKGFLSVRRAAWFHSVLQELKAQTPLRVECAEFAIYDARALDLVKRRQKQLIPFGDINAIA